MFCVLVQVDCYICRPLWRLTLLLLLAIKEKKRNEKRKILKERKEKRSTYLFYPIIINNLYFVVVEAIQGGDLLLQIPTPRPSAFPFN